MAKKTKVGTDVQQVQQQNQASASNQSQASASNQAGAGAGQFSAEFGSETNAQQVRKQNNKSQAKKGKNS